MLNEVYDTIEAILEGLDAGGEQSRAFAEEIKMLKDVLGYPEPGRGRCFAGHARGEVAGQHVHEHGSRHAYGTARPGRIASVHRGYSAQ